MAAKKKKLRHGNAENPCRARKTVRRGRKVRIGSEDVGRRLWNYAESARLGTLSRQASGSFWRATRLGERGGRRHPCSCLQ